MAIDTETFEQSAVASEDVVSALRQQDLTESAPFQDYDGQLKASEFPPVPYRESLDVNRMEQSMPAADAQIQAVTDDNVEAAETAGTKQEEPRQADQSAVVAEIASELAEYASLQAPLPYVNAEAAIAGSFRQQLAEGVKTINLSQRYATDDQTAAQARHEIALQNLQPLIDETAQLAGYKVERGQAIAEGLSQREVPAIVQQQRYSIGV